MKKDTKKSLEYQLEYTKLNRIAKIWNFTIKSDKNWCWSQKEKFFYTREDTTAQMKFFIIWWFSQIAKDKNECFQWMPQRNEHLCCPSVLGQHWKFPCPIVQVDAKEKMILVPLLFHQRLKRSPWEKCKCSWTSSGNGRRLLFCKWQLGHHWEKFKQV